MEIEIKYGVEYNTSHDEKDEKICDTLEDLINEIKLAKGINRKIKYINSYLVFDYKEFKEIDYYCPDEE